ncbi:SCO1664 family protein [Leekyejoonella antrihumi]|uniref:SCO1664 family protein n=1 Tax=Leekyejoonella antrihumi TaxID=1660198 RepID=A0A563DU47_9MICO|nr:SCO1664 family protein [Leekyejoonella antrihumi]TWP33214.1 SCO1664 family protein [Leekyejoonella antrihumi]
MPTDTSAERAAVIGLLTDGELEIEGRLVEASNVVLRVWLSQGSERIPAVYKPVRGERPLWDFPEGTLACREVAAWLVAQSGGWHVVPPTVLRDGPLGSGSVQQWVGPLTGWDDSGLVRLDRPREVPDGFVEVLTAEDPQGEPLVVSHASSDQVRALALLDLVLNNADRKGSAMIVDGDRLWAIDHGLCFHVEEKLRTVLWGFAGERLAPAERDRLTKVLEALDGDLSDRLQLLLDGDEMMALRARVCDLLTAGRFPAVPVDRTPLPWPLW